MSSRAALKAPWATDSHFCVSPQESLPQKIGRGWFLSHLEYLQLGRAKVQGFCAYFKKVFWISSGFLSYQNRQNSCLFSLPDVMGYFLPSTELSSWGAQFGLEPLHLLWKSLPLRCPSIVQLLSMGLGSPQFVSPLFLLLWTWLLLYILSCRGCVQSALWCLPGLTFSKSIHNLDVIQEGYRNRVHLIHYLPSLLQCTLNCGTLVDWGNLHEHFLNVLCRMMEGVIIRKKKIWGKPW